MEFYQKLNLLMKMQHVTNIRLAKALSVDPSLVSRWRTGIRAPSSRNSYIQEIAAFFAEQAIMKNQTNTLFEIINWPSDTEEDLSYLLYQWLKKDSLSETHSILGFLNQFNTPNIIPPLKSNVPSSDVPMGESLKTEVFHGLDGKRKGAIRFLSAVAASNKPCTILLYSDESMQWLMEDHDFILKWESLLSQIIAKGHKIKIIHTVTRDLTEMLTAIDRWLPIYMTGVVEAFYYPKYREPIFRKTMFIAPGIAAVSSSSLLQHEAYSQLFYYENPSVIKNLSKEFDAFLQLCYPLMQVFKNETLLKFTELWSKHTKQFGDSVFCSSAFSCITMPETLFLRLLSQSKGSQEQKQQIATIYQKIRSTFFTGLQYSNFIELINLSIPETFPDTTIVSNPRDLLGGTTIRYSRSDYCEHLKNIVSLLKNNPHYFLILHSKEYLKNFQFAIKEETGVIVAKNDCSLIFVFRQPSMTRAFQIYMDDVIHRIPNQERDKDAVIKKLNAMIANLQES